jgi:hypothetical protein
VRPRTRQEHAARLLRQMEDIQGQFEEARRERKGLEDSRFGLLLEVVSEPGYPLKFTSLTKGHSKRKDGIYLLNVRHTGSGEQQVTKATILVPYGRLNILKNKVVAYADPEKDSIKGDGTRTPKNTPLLSNIHSIRVAALEALWTEPMRLPPHGELKNWELWISREARAENVTSFVAQFDQVTTDLGLEVNEQRLTLPDHVVVTIQARREDLESSLDLLNTLTEVRAVHPCAVDLNDLPGFEQREWIDEALERLRPPGEDAPAVCVIDTGVNYLHPLLQPVLSEEDVWTILPGTGADQHGHGTGMAGLAAYDDLRTLMLATGEWGQDHRLESVKLIDRGEEHDPSNYGAVTQQGATLAESHRPHRRRAYCMAVTQPGYDSKGQPSAWSAAVDSLTAGSEEEGEPKRLMLISAGNVRNFPKDYAYPDSNRKARVENPAQAWNAISVGACTKRTRILEGDDESRNGRALAAEGTVSPFSRTSSEWEPHWPIKPDLVMEGGNLGIHRDDHLFEKDSLEPVTTKAKFHSRPFQAFNATSAATASASRLMAMLLARYPDFRPETHRGLLVHSARWTPGMLGGIRPHDPGQSSRTEALIREVGFGTPDIPRLFGSGSQGVTMVIEDDIQPYDPDSNAGSARLGNFNLYDLPWPRELMDAHPDVTLTLRATLSTFIHPNPGSRCWEKNQKYKYASHLLRFDFKRSTESDEVFRRNLRKQTEDSDEVVESRPQSDSKWALGTRLRGKGGSLVQDIWQGSPAYLREMGQLAVFPVKGWFATRKFPEGHEFHNCHQRQVRYSLIISIDAEQEIGLYNEIVNLVDVDVEA